ncbi:MAG: ZIP family metal transporter [Candidatus Sericytochromatia bacterium]|nr:ZIP family metal transporter [Candidatus Sericytochromatia bacterium]
MTTLAWIVAGGLAMTAIAGIGAFTLLLPPGWLERLLLPLVAFAAGALIGGALFHMIPAALTVGLSAFAAMGWVAVGFLAFLVLEQWLHHRHRHQTRARRPLTWLILVGDGLHNFLGGLAVAGVFLVDARLGLAAWLAAAAHEVPQELGDFAVLVHGGWRPWAALGVNLLSGLTFLAGGLLAWVGAPHWDLRWLLPLAAGNFLYLGAADLVPEVREAPSPGARALHLGAFGAGLGLLWALAA